MTTHEWCKHHQGWLGALMLCVGAFAIGSLTTTIVENRISRQLSAQEVTNSAQDQMMTTNRKTIEELRSRIWVLEQDKCYVGKH